MFSAIAEKQPYTALWLQTWQGERPNRPETLPRLHVQGTPEWFFRNCGIQLDIFLAQIPLAFGAGRFLLGGLAPRNDV
jgi:hypothetical protein